jgi:hypothetical protein
MVEKWAFFKHKFSGFFSKIEKHTCHNCHLCHRFYPIGIYIHLALQNDCQNLNFVKDICVVGKKWQEMVVKWPTTKVVSFFSEQTLFL